MDALTTAELAGLPGRLAALSIGAEEAELVDQLALLERVKAAACAVQARVTVAFKRARLEAEEAAEVPARHRGKGIAAEVALARRESPHKGGRLVGMAEALVHEMPHTLRALETGQINEWRATVVVKETACLSREDRTLADTALGDRLGGLCGLGDREVETEARKLAYGLDPHAFAARARKAESERRVTLRPAPDTMAYLTALLPLKQGVAAYAALIRHADQARATGDDRSRGQLVADTLVERVTGHSTADRVPVEVQLIVSASTLAGADDQPGLLTGSSVVPTPVPAPWARDLVRDTDAEVWVRRLYTHHGRLVAVESSSRDFPTGLRRQIIGRNQLCRTPWCNAPIRHLDHAVPADAGGPTTETNGQGLCEACNHAKQAPGWRTSPSAQGAGDEVVVTTPTGHTYRSHPPPLPGAA